MAQFGVYFDKIFPSENSRNLHLLHKNNAIITKPLLGSPGKEHVVQFGVYLIKVALYNVIVVRCNLFRFGVNFDTILLKKKH